MSKSLESIRKRNEVRKVAEATGILGGAREDFEIDYLLRYIDGLQEPDKRFSDAELAAEYFRAVGGSRIRIYLRDESGNIVDERGTGWEYERDVFARFALADHYDEGQA